MTADPYTDAALQAADALERMGEHRHANAVRTLCRKNTARKSALTSQMADNARLRFNSTRPGRAADRGNRA